MSSPSPIHAAIKMGNAHPSTDFQPPKIVVLSDVGDVSIFPNSPSETWAGLCRRLFECDYLPRLPQLLVRMHRPKRLAAYRLRYDVGMATVVKPTWSEDRINNEGGVEEAYLDANISLRPDPSRNSGELEFAPHETIVSTLGEKGAEVTTFVRVRFDNLKFGPGGVPPFPVRRERTRVLFCEEHPQFLGYTDCYRIEEWSEENEKLPRRIVNEVAEDGESMGVEDAPKMGKTADGAEGGEEAQTSKAGSEGAEQSPAKRTSPRRKKEKVAQSAAAGKAEAEKSSKPASTKKQGKKQPKEDEKVASNAVKKKAAQSSKSEKPGTKVDGDKAKGTNEAGADGKKNKEKNGDNENGDEKQQPPKKGRLVRSYPTGERDTHIPSEPAPKFPKGWTLRRFPRGDDSERVDVRYYSPIEDYRFLSKVEAKRFVAQLEEAEGDEKKAILLLKQGGNAKKPAKAGKKKKSDDSDEAGADKPSKAAAAKGKKRKSGDSKAVKKALEELKTGDNDGSQSDVESEEPKKKKPKAKKEGKAGESKAKGKEEKPAAAAKKRAKKEKDPNMPKRPANAYILFMKDARPRLAKEHPGLTVGELVGEAWKELSEDERRPYKNEAEAAKERYKAAMEEYRQTTV